MISIQYSGCNGTLYGEVGADTILSPLQQSLACIAFFGEICMIVGNKNEIRLVT
jgi:hypothetical protein